MNLTERRKQFLQQIMRVYEKSGLPVHYEKSTMANMPSNMLIKSIRATFILFAIASLFGIVASLKRGNMISDVEEIVQ